MILAKAAELSARSSSQDHSTHGLSLLEMKSIAKEIGLDPELIERAAHLVPGARKSSVMGRLFGGPLSSQMDLHIPVRLTPEGAQRLLSLVRATLLTHGQGEATTSGMSFSCWEAGLKAFVSAHLDGDGTRVRVVVDNRSRLVMPLVVAFTGAFLVTLLAGSVGPTGPGDPAVFPYLIFGGGMATITGLLWLSIRKAAQRTLGTLDDLVDVLSRFVGSGEAASS